MRCALPETSEQTIRKDQSDTRDLFSSLEEFGSRYMLSRRLMNRMITVAEELCVQTLLPMLKNGDELRLVYELGETASGSVNLEVTYPGPDINPLEQGQEAESIPLIIVRHACKDLCWQYRDGLCEIEGTVRND